METLEVFYIDISGRALNKEEYFMAHIVVLKDGGSVWAWACASDHTDKQIWVKHHANRSYIKRGYIINGVAYDQYGNRPANNATIYAANGGVIICRARSRRQRCPSRQVMWANPAALRASRIRVRIAK